MLLYLAFCLFQFWAIFSLIHQEFALHWLLSAGLGAVIACIPFVNTAGSIWGAISAWGWDWWWAVLAMAPGLVFAAFVMFGSAVSGAFGKKSG